MDIDREINSTVDVTSSSASSSGPAIIPHDPYDFDEWADPSSDSDFVNDESDPDERERRYFEIKKSLKRKIHRAKQAKNHERAQNLQCTFKRVEREHSRFVLEKKAAGGSQPVERRKSIAYRIAFRADIVC